MRGVWLTPGAAGPAGALIPRLAGAREPVETERRSGCWCREDRGCSKTHTCSPSPTRAPELRAAGRWWAPERWGTQCPPRALTRRPRQTLTTLGRVLPALQEAPTVSLPRAPQHVSPTSSPAPPPTWAWPCPGPMGGASHPVHPCAGRGGPGQSPPAPASTAHSPSPPPGAPTRAGGQRSVPGLGSGAPGHPARKRHSELWGRSRKCPQSTNPFLSQGVTVPI